MLDVFSEEKKNQTNHNPKPSNDSHFHAFLFVVVFTEDLQISVELISFYQSNLEMEAIPRPRFSCLLQLFILRWWEKKAVAALTARSNSWYFLLLKGLARTDRHTWSTSGAKDSEICLSSCHCNEHSANMQNVTLGCQNLQCFWRLLAIKLDVLWMVRVIPMSGTPLQQAGICKSFIRCLPRHCQWGGRRKAGIGMLQWPHIWIVL